ncbi:MAG: prepilin-type N-terminal cleavage/methylation domain-containing protein [Pseudobacteriovorax sp.]|nr:prepilin-type N-terminal cleavage/methylation domain-containing protein [Pseudobacteriovorax sp.]
MKKSQGFSLIEVIIALGILGLVSFGVMRIIDSSLVMTRSSSKILATSTLGEWAYEMSRNAGNLTYSAGQSLPVNDPFAEYYLNRNCQINQTGSFNLYRVGGLTPTAGDQLNPVRYMEKGTRCLVNEPGCNIELRAFFTPKCYNEDACAQAEYLVIRVDLSTAAGVLTSYSSIVTLEGFIRHANDECNPGSSDISQTIVVGFNRGSLRCGL